MNKNIFLSTLLIIFSTLVLSACTGLGTIYNPEAETVKLEPTIPAETGSPTTDTSLTKLKADYEFTATQSGQIALELLKSGAEIESTDYGAAGQFVTGINGLKGNNEYYWAFYLNDAYAEQGASQTKLEKGDTIKFVYEAVTTNN